MDVTPLVKQGQQIIQSYAGGIFKVSGEVFKGPVLVQPEASVAWRTSVQDISDLSEDDFSQLLAQADSIDVLLLGCGKEIAFLDKALKQALSDQGLPIEVMDSGAACRTYNVLMAEGRRVAALLLPT